MYMFAIIMENYVYILHVHVCYNNGKLRTYVCMYMYDIYMVANKK